MTDAELVKRLRNFDDGATPTHEAADRIATLTEQLEAARADAKEAEAYAEELERDLNTCRMAQVVMENTVAELGKQCEGLMQAGMNNGQALILAEAKLATCEKYRDAYDKMGRIGTEAYRELEAKLALMMSERDEAWRRAGHAEEQWGRCEVKFSKAVWLLGKHCDTWAMNDFDAETLAELLGEKV